MNGHQLEWRPEEIMMLQVDACGEVVSAPEHLGLAECVAGAFRAAGLGEILYPAPSIRDGNTVRFVIDLGYRASGTDAERVHGAIAEHLGVPAERVMIDSQTHCCRDRRVELVIRDAAFGVTDR